MRREEERGIRRKGDEERKCGIRMEKKKKKST